MKRELEMLESSDKNEISEGGYNMSGGKKKRIKIDREVYDEKDIIILDENLSEVDDKVDRKILRR
jgi:ABC-type multidrug transport system fused ATPase/permease subunit